MSTVLALWGIWRLRKRGAPFLQKLRTHILSYPPTHEGVQDGSAIDISICKWEEFISAVCCGFKHIISLVPPSVGICGPKQPSLRKLKGNTRWYWW